MAKIIIVISGKRGAGKNTLANQLAAAWLNTTQFDQCFGNNTGWTVNNDGLLCMFELSKPEKDRVLYPVSLEHGVGDEQLISSRGIRIISFATMLKEFCINVLGLSRAQCYGTDGQKDSITTVSWDGLPLRVRMKYRKRWWHRPLRGLMTGRKVMQVFGTDIVRQWHPEAWAVATYRMAADAKEDIVFIPDCRFPNEEWMKSCVDVPVKIIRLTRVVYPNDRHQSEIAMDNYPLSRFNKVVGNVDMCEMGRQCVPMFTGWIELFGVREKKAA